jgi:hypothetical protein
MKDMPLLPMAGMLMALFVCIFPVRLIIHTVMIILHRPFAARHHRPVLHLPGDSPPTGLFPAGMHVAGGIG